MEKTLSELPPDLNAGHSPLRMGEDDVDYWVASPTRLGDGEWVIRRYHDVKKALHDTRFSSRLGSFTPAEGKGKAAGWTGTIKRLEELFHSKAPASNGPIDRLLGRWFVLSDPPDHTRLRGGVKGSIVPRFYSAREAIRQDAERLIAKGRAAGTMDIDADLAFPLTARAMVTLYDLPADVPARFKGWFEGGAGFMGMRVRMTPDEAARGNALFAYFTQVLADKRKQRGDDLISDMITAQEQGAPLDDNDILACTILMLFGGYDTSRRMIVLGTDAFLQNPAQFKRLQQEPILIHSAMEEIARVASPTPGSARRATVDCDIRGVRIKRGEIVRMDIAAANRDPDYFSEPEKFDIARRPNPHFAFGAGTHFCLGAPYARLLGAEVFSALARLAPDIKLVADPARRMLPAGHGRPSELWVTL